ncbi:MAG: DUF554 domain-containing protein [Anaerovoracaceae bacterium]|nr:DUF554 domain-containing protein [Anaerovoracaceae bacterium]
MIGVLVNTLTVIVGSTIGLLFRKLIPEQWTDFIMKGIALCSLYIGIDGALEGTNTLVTIISIAVGALIGAALDLDDKLNRFASGLENRFKKEGSGGSTIAEGFVTASLLFCIGAMTIVGSLQAGLTGDNTMLYTKATLDFISSLIFAASLGIGVLFAAAFVLVFQGAIVLAAQAVSPFLTDYVVSEMTCAGSILIIALGLNILGVTNLKVMNFLPAIFLPIVLCLFM